MLGVAQALVRGSQNFLEAFLNSGVGARGCGCQVERDSGAWKMEERSSHVGKWGGEKGSQLIHPGQLPQANVKESTP